MNSHYLGGKLFVPAIGTLALCLATQISRGQNTFIETDLISNIPGKAALTDPNLKNPWGITSSATSPLWLSDNGAGVSTLYNSVTNTIPGLVVTIPAGAPTGAVFHSGSDYNGDLFIFATENGSIAGWRGALGTTAETLADYSGAGAVFKGLAIGTTGGNTYLYAADFHNSQITIVPGTGAPALAGNFTDPNLPAGYAPFNIQNLGGKLYVTYAVQDAAKHDDVAGAGNGFVDVFNLNGTLSTRLISNGALDSPWGLALAPAGFGPFGGDLLVGNFGDGSINAFDPTTGAFIDTLDDTHGNPLTIQGLWGLEFGNGGSGGSNDTLYFTAGLNDETDGLFGSLAHAPDGGSTLALVAGALVGLLGLRRRLAGPPESRA